MSFSLKLIIVFFLAFFESMVFFLPLTATFLVILALFEEKENVFILSFLSGLFLDVLQVRLLGTTSALFLLILFFVFLYKRKFIGKNPFFVGIFVFLATLASSYWVLRQVEISFVQALILTSLTLLFFLFRQTVKPVLR